MWNTSHDDINGLIYNKMNNKYGRFFTNTLTGEKIADKPVKYIFISINH